MSDTAEEVTPKKPIGATTSPENQARLDYILKRTNEEPGIASPVIAKELGITTLSTGQLADRLVAKGEIQLVKVGFGRTYYPKGFDIDSLPPAEDPKPKEKKVRAKKEKPAETEAP